jgi:hypothetical protein
VIDYVAFYNISFLFICFGPTGFFLFVAFILLSMRRGSKVNSENEKEKERTIAN